MSSVSVRLDDETDQLLQRLKDMSDIDKAGMMNAIAEGLRTSTLERFRTEESPDGKKWKRSIRAEKSGGKTLTKTRALSTSIHAQSDSSGLAVGTNLTPTGRVGSINRVITHNDWCLDGTYLLDGTKEMDAYRFEEEIV